MRAGTLRNKVTIQKPNVTKDSGGDVTTAWADDMEIYAGIWPIRGTEFHLAQQTKAGITHKVSMRFRLLSDGTRIGPHCRVRWTDPNLNADRTFQISAVIDPDERHRELTLMCAEEL